MRAAVLTGELHATSDTADASLLDVEYLTSVLVALDAVTPLGITIEDAAGTILAATRHHPVDHLERRPVRVRGTEVATVTAGASAVHPAGDDGNRPSLDPAAAASLVARLAVDRAELDGMTTELLEMYETVTLLQELTDVLGSLLDEESLCEAVVARASRVLGADQMLVAVAGEAGEMRVLATRGCDDLRGVVLGRDSGVSSLVARTGRQVLLHPGDEVPAFAGATKPRTAERSVLSVPLLRPDRPAGDPQPFGVLTAIGPAPGSSPASGVHRFRAADARLATTIAAELAVAISRTRMVDALRVAERAKKDLETAAEIQQGLLPLEPPAVGGATFAGRCIPAATVGGDYYDAIATDDGRVTFLVADVSGHNVGSALAMAMARASLRREAMAGRSPATILANTNDLLYDDLSDAGLFITVFCASYDPATGSIEFANGGHNPPLVRRAGGTLDELDADGMPLGIIRDAPYDTGQTELASGDVLLLYTDGITEARGRDAEMFGEPRLHEALVGASAPDATHLVDELYRAMLEFTDGAVSQDDVTLVALAIDRISSAPTALVVDDSPSIGRLLGFILEKEGWSVTTVETGRAAISAAGVSPLDVIFLDAELPDIDGDEVLVAIHDLLGERTPPVVMATGRDREDAPAGDMYLPKPFTRESVVAVLEAVRR